MRKLLIVVLAALVLAPAAGATFPGRNGRLVYSGGDSHLYSILPTGAAKRQITAGIDYGAAFSPDGRKLAFTRQENGAAGITDRIWVASADGSDAHAATSFDPVSIAGDAQPAWTRDGQLLYEHSYSRYADGFCILSLPATNVLCGGTDIVQDPLPSPVDEQLAFFRSRPRDGRTGMIFADQLWLQGAATSVLATGGDWSPDGKRLLLRQPDGTLGILDVGTGALRQQGVKAAGFTWSPDGTAVAYIAKNKLWVAAADGSHARAIAATPGASGLAWQPLPR